MLVVEDDVPIRDLLVAALEETLAPCDRAIVLELSEHDPVDDYRSLRDGFASVRHVLELEPAFVKLDRTWVDHIDEDKARRALIARLRHFADQTGVPPHSRGIERAPEVAVLATSVWTSAKASCSAVPARG